MSVWKKFRGISDRSLSVALHNHTDGLNTLYRWAASVEKERRRLRWIVGTLIAAVVGVYTLIAYVVLLFWRMI